MRDGTARQRGRRVAIAVVFVLIAAACTPGGATSIPTSTQAPGTSASSVDGSVPPPPPPAPMAVALARSGPPVDVAAGTPASFTSYVLSDAAITKLELWDGADLVDAEIFDKPATRLAFGWTWTPSGAGVHLLLGRAVDMEGRVGQSFPLWVRVASASSPEALVPGTPARGTFTSASSRASAVAAGLLELPPAPTVATDTETCVTTVAVPANTAAAGMAVYTAEFGSSGFVAVGLLPPEGGDVAVPASSVPTGIYYEAYDAATAAPSSPVMVPPSPCADTGWTGDVQFFGGVLTTNIPVDRAYLYVSADGEAWDRVPQSDQTFVERTSEGFDFNGLLPAPNPGLSVEAWGWDGVSLKPLGTGVFTKPPVGLGNVMSDQGLAGLGAIVAGDDLDWIVGQRSADWSDILVRIGTLCTYPKGGVEGTIFLYEDDCVNTWPTPPVPNTFLWTPTNSVANHAIYQVGLLPPPSGPILFYPGLVAYGDVDKPEGASRRFDIDLESIIYPKTPEGPSPGVASNAGAVTYQSLPGLGPSMDASGAQQNTMTLIESTLASASGANRIYVRVMPMKGSQPLPGASNVVRIDIRRDPPPEKAGIIKKSAFDVNVEMSPPRWANFGQYGHCVRVVENPYGAENPQLPEDVGNTDKFSWMTTARNDAFIFENGKVVHKGLIPGATVCGHKVPPPEDHWYDFIVDAVNAAAWVWDQYVDFLAKLKSTIISVVVELSGCKPKDVCKDVLSYAADVGLVSVGIPPTLPNFEQLVEASKGDLTDLIVEAAAQSHILDCGETLQSACEEMADKAVGAMINEAQTAISAAAVGNANGGDYKLVLNPKIKVVPEPAGTLAPAMFSVTFTPAHGKIVPPPDDCTVLAAVYGEQTHPAGGYSGPLPASELVMYGTKSLHIGKLAPGESKTFTVVLDTRTSDPGPLGGTGSLFFREGATLTTELRGCGLHGSLGLGPDFIESAEWPVDGHATQPWDIPIP